MVVRCRSQPLLNHHTDSDTRDASTYRPNRVWNKQEPIHLVSNQFPKSEEPDHIACSSSKQMISHIVPVSGTRYDRERHILDKSKNEHKQGF